VTICIAAICENGQKVVACADRMITIGMLSREFEHTRSKIIPLSKTCLMMTAGPALRDIDLQKHVLRAISGRAEIKLSEIVSGVKEGYQKARRQKIEELFIKPRGLSLEEFLQSGRGLLPEAGMMIDESLATFDYGLDILVAGIDNEGAHVYYVENPGTSECFDSIGYHAIGSGEPLAISSLIESGYSGSMSLQEAMWAVFEAKKRSENAPGVGKAADFTIIDSQQTLPFDAPALEKLEQLYTEFLAEHEECFQTLKPKLNTIPIPKSKPI